MFLSQLLIDTGLDPDRPRPGRRWLGNPYHVHQRLCMAFPSAGRRAADGAFLAPYRPEDFQEHARVPRDAEAGFLYRVEPGAQGRAVILVQSVVVPDFAWAFHNAGFLLAAPPATKPYEPTLSEGERLRFRLRANPTFKREGKRLAWLSEEDQLRWLARKGETGGFALEGVTATSEGFRRGRKGGGDATHRMSLFSVLFEGRLDVTDAVRFAEVLRAGVGSGKALGFGLLSVAR